MSRKGGDRADGSGRVVGLKGGLGVVRGAGARQPVVAAVDLGASKIGCFIMKPDGVDRDAREVQAAGVAHVRSEGIKAGAIVDIEACGRALVQAVERAEAMAGVTVSAITVVTATGQLMSHRVTSAVSLSARPIADADLSRALQLALAQTRFTGRRAIHLLPVAWSVDGHRGVRDPRNMFGRQLGLELLVVTMAEPAYANLAQCVELNHLQLEGVVAAPLASALAALEDDEMDLGCLCIDMGGGSTSAAVFQNGSLVHVDSAPVGGSHVTADIARGLSTTIAGAERIKTLHGSAMASPNEERGMIEAPPRGDDPGAGPVVAPRSLLKGIVAPRVEETLELLRDRLRQSGAPLEPGAGIVLTGGASQLSGARETAVRVFDRPVRLGRPRRAPHLADAAAGPAFCAVAGVLQRHAFGPREVATQKLARARVESSAHSVDADANVIVRAAGWLRANL
ncbi:cell division protein FtsA [soil metagenome]